MSIRISEKKKKKGKESDVVLVEKVIVWQVGQKIGIGD